MHVVSMIPPRAYLNDLGKVGVTVDTLGMRRGVPDPRAVLRLAGMLKRRRPLVLHSHMVHANLLSRLTRPFYRVPAMICTAHSTFEGGSLREWAYRMTDRLCDLTTQVSQVGLERYVRIGVAAPHKIRFVPNGVDTKRFRPDFQNRFRLRAELGLQDDFIWLAVGRFEEAKDYPNLIRAFASVVRRRGRTVLLIVGQGPLRKEVERLARELGVTAYLRFMGVRGDIPDLMNAADGYVMSSAWEGLPIVLLEASASGLPVVATDVGGNREVVLEGKSGILVPPKDHEALARSMLQIMALPQEIRVSMGMQARQHIEDHYALDKLVDQWEALYWEVLRKREASF